ncbi:cation-translocating P-type ATPase [Leuconostoc fallax]|uniref:heavy metal translocating P-type ATPase n=1 Tax=Leuconostoc fallax TaxID=1251 RepID=UPI002091A1FE|nr:cation-translocating P-type ATPase [Leuconostoc fallax]MCO6183209.1 cation-translocating P-type ATPase [Leuconostoc fallax]
MKILQLTNQHQKIYIVLMTSLIILSFVSGWLGNGMIGHFIMLVVTILGGSPIVIQSISALRYKVVSIELLVSFAVIGAILIGEFSESGIVVWLFALGRFLEARTLTRTRSAIAQLVQLMPKQALRISTPTSRIFELIDIDDIQVGDYVLVKTGSQIPVDGKIVNGEGAINEASITGESKINFKSQAQNVFAGTSLDSGTLVIQADKVGEDTAFGKIIDLVETSQDSQSQAQQMIDRFAKYYTPVVLVLAVLIGIVTRDIRLAITVLILGCPGALVIGVPVSTVAGIGVAARHGILVKGSEALVQLRKVTTFAFDKTGTVTKGTPTVTAVQNYQGLEMQNLAIVASIEHESNHPLAQAIQKEYTTLELMPIDKTVVIKGKGIVANVGQQQVVVGNQQLMHDYDIDLTISQQDTDYFLREGYSLVYVAINHQLHLLLGIHDPLKPEATKIMQQLRELDNQRLVLMSGDQQRAVEIVAHQLKLTQAYGDCLPENKMALIQQYQSHGERVAFVGDGVNDSPALVTANVGIAMGNGTDIAMDVADIVLMHADLNKLPLAVKIARATVMNMYQNIIIAMLTVVFLLIGLFTGYIFMASGMLIHELSIIVVTLNGVRLLRL